MLRTAVLFLVGGLIGATTMLWLDDTERGSIGADARSAGPGLPREGEVAAATLAGLEQVATGDPVAALDEALAIDDPVLGRRAIERIAAAWVARDPLAAIAEAERLPPRLRSAFLAAVDAEWARLDAAGYLAHLESDPGFLETLTGRGQYQPDLVLGRSAGLQLLLASDPLRVALLADTLSSRLGRTLRAAAMTAYAERNPAAAIALAERIPQGQNRTEALTAVAEGYALVNPESALAWVQSLSPLPMNALSSVLAGMARNDMRRAVALSLQIRVGSGVVGDVTQFPPITAVLSAASGDPVLAAQAANALLESDDSRRNRLLGTLLGQWARNDPESVVDWIERNAASVGAEGVTNAAYAIATEDAALAASYTGRVPPALRPIWIERVAQGYALWDGARALEWIEEFRGQEGYDAGLQLVLANYAPQDPPAAARALANASTEVQFAAIAVVADQWARSDTAAAVEWAQSLRETNVRHTALAEAVGVWMTKSSQEAEDWTLGLPPGADRDRALYTLLRGRTYTNAPRESYSNHATEMLIAQVSDAATRREIEGWFD